MFKRFTLPTILFVFTFILLTGIVSSKGFTAENVTVGAVGRVVYEEFSADVERKAIYLAKKSALKKYFRRLPTSQKVQLKELEVEFYKNIDDYIAEVNVQQDKNDEDRGIYLVAIRAAIDAGAIEAFFIANSASANQKLGDESSFLAIFVARRETGRKSYDARRTSISETDSTQSQIEENSSSDTRSASSSRDRTFDKKSTGGSTSRKRAKVGWEYDDELSQSLAAVIEEKLTDNHFAPEDLDELDVPGLDEVEMSKKGTLPSTARKAYKRAAADEDYEFLGFGTVDVGTARDDRATGGIKVAAKVSFKVSKLNKRGRYKRVASVRPTVVWGIDPSGDASVAEANALNAAGEFAMETIISQLQSKGIR